MKYIYALLAFTTSVQSWTVEYYLGNRCNGEMTGSDTIDQTSNICVPVNAEGAESILVVADGVTSTDISAFAGGDCTGLLLGSRNTQGCIPLSEDGFGSIGVST